MKGFKRQQNRRLSHIVREKGYQEKINSLKLANANLVVSSNLLNEEIKRQKRFIDIVARSVDELFIGFEAKRVESFDGYPEEQPIRIHKKSVFSRFNHAGDSVDLDEILNTMHKIGFDVCIDALNGKLHAYVKVNGENRVAYSITKDGFRLLPKDQLINQISKSFAEFMRQPEFLRYFR